MVIADGRVRDTCTNDRKISDDRERIPRRTILSELSGADPHAEGMSYQRHQEEREII